MLSYPIHPSGQVDYQPDICKDHDPSATPFDPSYSPDSSFYRLTDLHNWPEICTHLTVITIDPSSFCRFEYQPDICKDCTNPISRSHHPSFLPMLSNPPNFADHLSILSSPCLTCPVAGLTTSLTSARTTRKPASALTVTAASSCTTEETTRADGSWKG